VPRADDSEGPGSRWRWAPFELTITGQTIRRVLLGLIIGAALGGLIYLLVLLLASDPFGGLVNPGRYQAVFLSDGRVYFGNLEEGGEDFYELRNAFFIEEIPGPEGEAPTRQVRPVTEEFQQPEGSVLIAKDQVVVVENLRPDSDVAEAIDRVRGAG
jgi:hypothetical protein